MEHSGEVWVDLFANTIPKQSYTMQLEAGEDGLLIHLDSTHYAVTLDFGVVRAVNILDEGIQLNDLPGCPTNYDVIPNDNFLSTIYYIKNGRYARYVKTYLGSTLFEDFNLRQYNIITMNYVVMIVAQCTPIIKVNRK